MPAPGYELGVVTEVVGATRSGERLREFAAMVNRNAPLVVRGTRLAIRKGLGLPLYEAELLAEAYRDGCSTPRTPRKARARSSRSASRSGGPSEPGS